MNAEQQTLLGLLIILSLGLVVPDIVKKTVRLPFVTSLILIGAVLGPFGFDVVESNEIIDFFGFMGFTFLMLMAGLETHMREIKEHAGKISVLAIINAGIPFATGIGIGRAFEYSWLQSMLLGTIFVSSSVAIIIPLMSSRQFGSDVRKLMLPAFVVEDLLSIILLASVLQGVAPITDFPLPIYFAILAVSIGALFFFVPRLATLFVRKRILTKRKGHEDQLRFVMVLLISVLLYFSVLGVHPILGAFLVGMLLSDLVTSQSISNKIHTLGYGLFVPVFFFIVGMEMDLTIFFHFDFRNLFILSIIAGLILSKFISGYFAARIINLSKRSAATFGVVSTTQLTTTLAAAYAASALGLFDNTLLTAVVTLAIVTNIAVPITLRMLVKRSPFQILVDRVAGIIKR